MDRDGARTGFDLALTRAVVDAVEVPVIASGGVGSLADLVDGDHRRRRGRRARGVDLPLRRIHDRAGEADDGRGGNRDAVSEVGGDAPVDDWLDAVNWQADGLVPAIAQDAATGKVLTLAWMNREALARTARTRRSALLVALAARAVAARASSPATSSGCARSASTATTMRSWSSSSRKAASPVTPDASAASSSSSTTTAGRASSPC